MASVAGASPSRSAGPGSLGPIRVSGAESEFDKKYPFDAYGEEAAPDARVWTVYKDHATTNDAMRLDGWNKTLDILLIFAGLFSAVVTTFIGESYQQLQPDWEEYTGRLVFAVLEAQHTPGQFALPNMRGMAPSSFSAPCIARWINALWVLSLILSLGVALLAILAKQWLVQYDARITSSGGSPRDWALRHAFYVEGFETWRIGTIIEMLPLLLHLALVLFLAGLVLFFWTLDAGVAGLVLLLTAALLAFYLSTISLSLWFPACPYYLAWFGGVHSTISFLVKLAETHPPTAAGSIIYRQTHLIVRALSRMATADAPTDVNLVAISAIGSHLASGELDRKDNRGRPFANRHLYFHVEDLLYRAGSSIAGRSAEELIIFSGDISAAAYRYLSLWNARAFLSSPPVHIDVMARLAPELSTTCAGGVTQLTSAIATRNSYLIRNGVWSLASTLSSNGLGRWKLPAAQLKRILRLLADTELGIRHSSECKSVALRLVQPALTSGDSLLLAELLIRLNVIFDRPERSHSPASRTDVLEGYLAFYLSVATSRSFDTTGPGLWDIVPAGIVQLLPQVRSQQTDPPWLPLLCAFMASRHSFGALWDYPSLDRAMGWLCGAPLSDTALQNFAWALIHSENLAALVPGFQALLTWEPDRELAELLLRPWSSGLSIWRVLCDATLAQATAALPFTHLIALGETLAKELLEWEDAQDKETLVNTLISTDVLVPLLALATAQDIVRPWMRFETVGDFLCVSLPELAPHLWDQYSEAVHARASAAVKDSPIWDVFLETEAKFAADQPVQSASESAVVSPAE